MRTGGPCSVGSGWFDRHEDAEIPAAIDFVVTYVAGSLYLSCPTCAAEYEARGASMQYGRISSLINDHIRMHYPLGWGQKW